MANIREFEEKFVNDIKLDLATFEASEFVAGFEHIDKSTGGWSGASHMAMLNMAVSFLDDGEEYLEIGTFCGKSLAGALQNNLVRAQVIDNFWDGEHVEKEWNDTVDRYNLRDRITLHKCYTEQWIGTMPTIGVYFYDGNHDSGHTYEGVKKFASYLSDRAIVVVDDYMLYVGPNQHPLPHHNVDIKHPVKTDTDRLLAEDSRFRLIGVTPWGQQQAVMVFER